MFVIARSDGSGAVTSVNAYDEYGIPASGNTGRFQYTGQQWLAELGMYHYRARIYSPTMGRFLQTDPIGYRGGMNLHAYVGNDPVNMVDPTGLDGEEADGTDCDAGLLFDASPQDNAFCQNVYVTGRRLRPRMQLPMSLGLFFFGGGGPAIGSGSSGEQTAPAEVVNCPANAAHTLRTKRPCSRVRGLPTQNVWPGGTGMSAIGQSVTPESKDEMPISWGGSVCSEAATLTSQW